MQKYNFDFYEAWNKLDDVYLKDNEKNAIFDYKDFLNNGLSVSDKYSFLYNLPGIYMFTNLSEGHHMYVGQAVNLYIRLRQHASTAKREAFEYLEPIDCAIKNGDNFTIEILYTIERKNNNADISNALNEQEKKFIEKYKTYTDINNYNLTEGGANSINHYRQSGFWNEAKGCFNKRLLNKVRREISTLHMSYPALSTMLTKKHNLKKFSTKTVERINKCEGLYKLNYYERATLGFNSPLAPESIHQVGSNGRQSWDEFLYVFTEDETILTPENALNKDFPCRKAGDVAYFLGLDATNIEQCRTISHIAGGLSANHKRENPRHEYKPSSLKTTYRIYRDIDLEALKNTEASN